MAKTNRLISRDEAGALDLASRIKLEMAVTDGEVKKAVPLELAPGWHFEQYRTRSPWRAYLFDFLGDLAGRTILDLGCGYHPTPIYFALAGAERVYACDVSPKALAYIKELAEQFNVSNRVFPVLCAGERLSFAESQFDLVHGEAVLHHLNISRAGAEIARVLRSEGRAAFKDPLGQNPLLEFARDYLPYSWKASAKGTDRPLVFSDIERFGRQFATCSFRAFGLLSMLGVALFGRDNSKLLRTVHRLDTTILTAFPVLQRYCRFVVTCAAKSAGAAVLS